MALGMRPDKFQSTGIDYRAILTDVVVIADTAEATATVISSSSATVSERSSRVAEQ